jgi:hypothetical protein
MSQSEGQLYKQYITAYIFHFYYFAEGIYLFPLWHFSLSISLKSYFFFEIISQHVYFTLVLFRRRPISFFISPEAYSPYVVCKDLILFPFSTKVIGTNFSVGEPM